MDTLYCKGFTPDPNGKKTIWINGEKIQGQWVEGYYVKMHKTTYCFGNEEPKDNTLHQILFEQMTDWNLPNQYYRADILPETLCNYIGIRDKNGNWVCEDDIVKISKFDLEGTVCKEKGTFGIGTSNIINYLKIEKTLKGELGNDVEVQMVQSDHFLSFYEILENFNLNENDRCELIEIIGNKWENRK